MRKLAEYSEKIKHLPRSGWLRKNVQEPESVAAHSWQMSLIALYLSEIEENHDYDFNHVIKLCICHDLAESKIGDITPKDVAYSTKGEIEIRAMTEISENSNFPLLKELFQEFEKGQTKEAQLARDIDKIDMLLQALDYERKYPKENFDEFKESAIKSIKTGLGKKIVSSLVK